VHRKFLVGQGRASGGGGGHGLPHADASNRKENSGLTLALQVTKKVYLSSGKWSTQHSHGAQTSEDLQVTLNPII
jgi:hypothetical protein